MQRIFGLSHLGAVRSGRCARARPASAEAPRHAKPATCRFAGDVSEDALRLSCPTCGEVRQTAHLPQNRPSSRREAQVSTRAVARASADRTLSASDFRFVAVGRSVDVSDPCGNASQRLFGGGAKAGLRALGRARGSTNRTFVAEAPSRPTRPRAWRSRPARPAASNAIRRPVRRSAPMRPAARVCTQGRRALAPRPGACATSECATAASAAAACAAGELLSLQAVSLRRAFRH